ncbi:MAG: hypothetical protein M3081_04595 [Gemmatimonadota bacterium]|nr:hypothetical protein [Gemmatimonadota bacterium]
MKAYIMTTGVLFGLLALAHVGRAIAEGWGVATSPFFMLTTVLAAAMSVWAWRVLRLMARP